MHRLQLRGWLVSYNPSKHEFLFYIIGLCRILNGNYTYIVTQSFRMFRCVNWWLVTDILKYCTPFLHQGQALQGNHKDKFTTLLRNVGDDLPVDIEHTRRLESTTTQLRQSEISHYSYSMCRNKKSSFNIYGLMYYLSGVKPGVTVVPGSFGAPMF
jgi:hypothetical protein